MRERARLASSILLLLLLVAACAPKGKPADTAGGATGSGDTTAAAAATPTPPPVDPSAVAAAQSVVAAATTDSSTSPKKVLEAKRKLADAWTQRGEEANAAGRVAEAGDWWRKAIEILPEEEQHSSQAWGDVEQNLSALEYAGDNAIADDKAADAYHAFSVLALVHPENSATVDKSNDAKKRYAASLTDHADDLYRKSLPGAALAVELQALELDPMQKRAFQSAGELKHLLRKKSHVQVESKIEDAGYKPLAAQLATKLSPAMDNAPPYGRAVSISHATLRLTIETYSKDEVASDGVDEMPNEEPASTTPIPNPQIEQLKEKIDRLQKKLADDKAQLHALVTAKKGGGTAHKGGTKPAPAATPGAAAAGGTQDPGLALARDIDKTRVDIASAQARIQQLPATVLPPPPDPTWKLPWSKTTRTVHARVRFEIQEPDYAEPLVVESDQKVEKSSREDKGNALHHAPPHPLQLPSWDEMNAELADALVGEGAAVLAKARDRRMQTLLDRGHTMQQSKDDDQAIDAYVGLLYMVGLEKLPDDVSHYLSDTLGSGGKVADLLDKPDVDAPTH